MQLVAMTLLRLIRLQLDQARGEGQWWLKPGWNRRQRHPSLLDLRRLFWRYRNDFSHFLCELENIDCANWKTWKNSRRDRHQGGNGPPKLREILETTG